jgi:hypothetical protein
MAINLTKTLRKALVQLQSEKQKIDQQIAAIQSVLAVGGTRRPPQGSRSSARGKRPRKAMSAAARKAVSRRMKEYWAKRKVGAAKGKGVAEK